MPIDPETLCPCHGLPMYRRPSLRFSYCVVKRTEATRRYHASARGQVSRKQCNDRSNVRRVRIGQRDIGRAETAEEAARLNAYIRSRVRTYTQEQRWRSVETVSQKDN